MTKMINIPAAPQEETMDDDDLISIGSGESARGSAFSSSMSHDDQHNPRDEVKEVKKMTSKDNKSVNVSRLLATCALLVTAVCVTSATYLLLKDEERNNFETAVSSRQDLWLTYVVSVRPLTFLFQRLLV